MFAQCGRKTGMRRHSAVGSMTAATRTAASDPSISRPGLQFGRLEQEDSRVVWVCNRMPMGSLAEAGAASDC